MGRGTLRPFRLLDLMAIIGLIAVGFAISRSFGDFASVRREVRVSYWADKADRVKGYRGGVVAVSDDYAYCIGADYLAGSHWLGRAPKGRIIFWARRLAFWPGPWLAALSLGVVMLGVGRAEQPRTRTGMGPGAVVSIAVLLAMMAAAVRLPLLLVGASSAAPGLHFRWGEWWLEFWFTVPRLSGFAVMVSWATLAMSGSWRAGGGWPDRLGLVLGMAWIGIAVIDLASYWYITLPI